MLGWIKLRKERFMSDATLAHQAAMAAYFNVARHNLLEVLNQIAHKSGLGQIDNDDQVSDHPVLKRLAAWAEQEGTASGRIGDNDIYLVKQVVDGLQRAMPILSDDFVQAISGQRISLDMQASRNNEAGPTLAPLRQASHGSSDKPMRSSWRMADLHWALSQLTKHLMALRNFYSHAHQAPVLLSQTDGKSLTKLLGIWFDAARREAKSRMGFLEHEVNHLLRHNPNTKREDPDAPHALTLGEENSRRLSERGAAFFCCLFLGRQQGNEFLRQLTYFKPEADRLRQATLCTYTLLAMRVPYMRLETDSTHQSLALNMLSELARCPIDIFRHLSPEDQKTFEIQPEAARDWATAADADADADADVEGQGAHFVRYSDRFAPLIMEYFDYLAQTNSAHDTGIRFALDLGEFLFAAYPKRLPDGSTYTRRLKQKVLRFGLLSRALQQERNKPEAWKSLERSFTERDYTQPYIVERRPRYHLSQEGGSIPIQLKRDDAAPLYLPPEAETERTNPDGSARYKRLPSERPDYWLSPYELVNLAFYNLLRSKHDLPRNEFPMVDDLLRKYSSTLNRFYLELRERPEQWMSDGTEALAKKLQHHCNTTGSSFALRPRELPDDLRRLLLNTVKPTDEVMLAQAQRTLALLYEDGQRRLSDVQLVKHSLRERMKPGKHGHRVLRAGDMAVFLSKDMLRLQPDQDAASPHRGKPTGIMANLLQARLAYFGRDKSSLPDLFARLGLTGHNNTAQNHPFLQSIDLCERGMNGIAQFYEAYLVERQKHLQALQQQLKSEGLPALQTSPLTWLNLAQTPKRLQNRNAVQTWAGLYLQRESTPLNLPRGLFRVLTMKAMLSLGNPALTEAVQGELAVEAVRGRDTSASVLIALYMTHIVKDTSQDFFRLPLTKFRDHCADLKGENWSNSDWAKRTRSRLKKANRKIASSELDEAMSGERNSERTQLRTYSYEMGRSNAHQAAQDQVQFLAAKHLMALRHGQHKGKASTSDDLQVNPFEKIRLQFISRHALNQMTDHELQVHGKIIYTDRIRAKDIGRFRRLAHDRRLRGILYYYEAERVHLDVISYELRAYPNAQHQAFKDVLSFEQRQNASKQQAASLPKRQSLHRHLLEQGMREGQLPTADQERIKAETLTLRNAFCHNQTPAAEDVRGAQGEFSAALPMLEQARVQLVSARRVANDINNIKGGNTVAQHFARLLAARYTQIMAPNQSQP
jgi:hypothetical protein